MANLFSLKSVPGGTQNELTARSTIKGITWAAQRFPWVHISSMSSACGEFKTMSSKLTGAIGDSYESGLVRPKPVITGVKVKKQGELGTTRSCTVELKAFTDTQLVALQKCYFIPGMTVRVQWGWSVSATGGVAPEPVVGGLPDGVAICQMQKKAGSSAIYDGLQGLITNFNFKLNSENEWDCSFELVAAAEATGDGKVAVHNDKCSGCERTYKSEDESGDSKDVVEKKSLLGTFFYDVDSDASDGEMGFGDFKGNLSPIMEGNAAVIAGGNYEGEDRDGTGGSAQSSFSGGNYDTTEGYISYSTLEAAINRYAFPTSGGKFILGKVISTDLMVKSHPKLKSGDPRICLIPGSPQLSKQTSMTWNWMGSVPSIWSPDEINFGGIMINCVFLIQELKAVEDGDNKVHTFLTNVVKKISNTCGGYWNDMLELVSTTEDCANPKQVPTLSLVDLRKFTSAAAYAVPSNPNNSVIRDLKLDMKLTGAMKSQALYSNGAKQNGKGAKCDTIAFSPFGLADAGSIAVDGKPKAATPPPCDCSSTKQAGKSEKKTFDEIFEEMWDVVDNGTTGAAIAAVTDAVNGGDDVKEKCVGMPLPFDFGFTVDGVGGFAFGQCITSDRIPPAVKNAFDFQITSVEHDISIQDWTTTVSTVARFKK
jgi:hypothetical protein